MKLSIFVLGLTVMLLAFNRVSYSDSDHDHGRFGDRDHDRGWSIGKLFGRNSGITPVVNKNYNEECSSCHFAYPAGLLPAQSWSKIMTSLDDHFGDNAELDEPMRTELENYLVANSADRLGHRRSRKIMRSFRGGSMPLRITELAYFRDEHDEIPRRLVTDNPQVRSFSNCDACHQRADQGSFGEREINIPGHGRWDD